MYNRNRIYITPEEQAAIKHFHIVLAGAGLGSVIAECALRLGFERITIVDGDVVEESNLNRQNYTRSDVGMLKVEALKKRLISINPHAEITVFNCFITGDTVAPFLRVSHDVKVAINAMDFTSNVPFVFDDCCVSQGIPVLHPYNIGWASCVFVVHEMSERLSHISPNPQGFEMQFIDWVIQKLAQNGENTQWLQKLIEDYKNEEEALPAPQLSVASWITAGICTDILFRLATGKDIKLFPEFYFKQL
jgi:molybdopterin/thiamine biosynthesis adenylyltransferase